MVPVFGAPPWRMGKTPVQANTAVQRSAAEWAPAHVEQPVLAIVLYSDIQHLVEASLKMRVVS
jgi:hypothetical protein